ncbi:alpha/beta hydrolase [Lacticaseibacillus sp. GG6-2]
MTTFIPGTSATTLLLLHGTGGSERDLVPLAHFVAPEAAVLSIGGRVAENGEARYFRHRADGSFDFADLARQTTWLLDTVAAALTQYQRAVDHTLAMGYSNGANIAARAMLEKSVPWRDALFFHPMRLGNEDPHRALNDAHVWLSHGAHDPFANSENFTALETLFSGSGAAVTTYYHQHGHQLTNDELEAAKTWFAQLKEE